MENKLNIAYFGTPSLSLKILEYIYQELSNIATVKHVITNPDKKVGRKQLLTPSPIKMFALKQHIAVFDQPLTKKNPDYEQVKEQLREILQQTDLAIVFAYGYILPQDVLAVLPNKFVNIHPSLLPKHRGPSPTVWPLLLGESQTGVTIMLMDEYMDHGPIVLQDTCKINPLWTRGALEERLIEISKNLLKQTLYNFFHEKKFNVKPQNHTEATYTKLLKKNDGFISFSLIQSLKVNKNIKEDIIPEFLKQTHPNLHPDNIELALFNMYRALYGWPGLWTRITLAGVEKRLKILECSFKGRFSIEKVQLEGKKPVDTKTFYEGYGIGLP